MRVPGFQKKKERNPKQNMIANCSQTINLMLLPGEYTNDESPNFRIFWYHFHPCLLSRCRQRGCFTQKRCSFLVACVREASFHQAWSGYWACGWWRRSAVRQHQQPQCCCCWRWCQSVHCCWEVIGNQRSHVSWMSTQWALNCTCYWQSLIWICSCSWNISATWCRQCPWRRSIIYFWASSV